MVIGLASEKIQAHVPFEQVEKDTSRFVSPVYRPQNLTIKDPRNMLKESILRLLRHIYTRQNEHGIENAFRFKIYLGKDREDIVAKYPPPRTQSQRATLSPDTTVPPRSGSETAPAVASTHLQVDSGRPPATNAATGTATSPTTALPGPSNKRPRTRSKRGRK